MDNLEAQLVIDNADMVYKYFLSIGVDRQIAEDLTGDAIYKAILYFEGIRPGKLKAWMFRVALNGYYDLMRKNKRLSLYDNVDMERICHTLMPGTFNSVESSLLNRELGERISRTLAQMGSLRQEVLLLRTQLNLSYREIAVFLDIPVDTVRTYLYRARKEFKRIWEEEDEGQG